MLLGAPTRPRRPAGGAGRYAFDEPVTVRLGRVREFDNRESTFYVEVLETLGLDRARDRLYDGAHLRLEAARAWTWHVTCVRASRGRADRAALCAAAQAFRVDLQWAIDTIGYLELRGDRYKTLREWTVVGQAAARGSP